MTKQDIIQRLEEARIASFKRGKSWMMDNGQIAETMSQKRREEDNGAKVYAMFINGEQVERG